MQGLILEFDRLSADDYDRVNEILGLDMNSGEGDWPPGLMTHVGGAKEDGWIVFELWSSRADQERFLAELQDADAELNEVERILRMEESATAGSCPSCGAPHSSGATFCWQCGKPLLEQVSGDTILRR
jgi:hypothetical protein